MLLQGVLAAKSKVLLKLNAKEDVLSKVNEILPSLHAPTVNKLSENGWSAVEAVVEEDVVKEIIPLLKAIGAEGIIEIPLNKIIS